MNRRVVLRTLSVAASGIALSGRFLLKESDPEISYSIVTGDADDVIARLRKLGYEDGSGFVVSRTAIAPSQQDLAVVRSGNLLQPEDLEGWAADLMIDLRSRRVPGNYLVTVESDQIESNQPAGTVEFRVDGQMVDRVSVDRRYRHVEIPGTLGPTVFSIEDGRASVHSSSCRRQLCRNCGSVGSGRIVCAPNRLIATVTGTAGGAGTAPTYDAVTG